MVVGRTFFRKFQVGKIFKSFLVVEIYMRVEAEKFFSLDNALLRVLTPLF